MISSQQAEEYTLFGIKMIDIKKNQPESYTWKIFFFQLVLLPFVLMGIMFWPLLIILGIIITKIVARKEKL